VAEAVAAVLVKMAMITVVIMVDKVEMEQQVQ
jgi:hypothetical protein